MTPVRVWWSGKITSAGFGQVLSRGRTVMVSGKDCYVPGRGCYGYVVRCGESYGCGVKKVTE